MLLRVIQTDVENMAFPLLTHKIFSILLWLLMNLWHFNQVCFFNKILRRKITTCDITCVAKARKK